MNQLAQYTIIGAERVGGVEAAQTHGAQRALPFLVQRKLVQKRRAAGGAEKFRVERLGGGETSGTNRDTADFVEGLGADTTLAGEDEGKKGASGCPDY